MLGVKFTILLWAISIVWGIFASSFSKTVKNAFRIAKKDYPWWYTAFGLLIMFDLFGFLYVIFWLLFL